MLAMLLVQSVFLICLMATGSCQVVDQGQFFQLGEKKDSGASSEVVKSTSPILNEDFFKCHKNEKHCPVVSKDNAGTAQTWRRIDHNYELATGKHTAQSSTFGNPAIWGGGGAVDGNKGHIPNQRTNPCSLTKKGAQQWWMVTFDREAVIYRVSITSMDGSPNYFNWMKDFSIKVGNVKDHGANHFCKKNVGIHKSGKWLFKCDKQISGRYLYIVNNLNDAAICFCEVEVSGSYI